MENKPKRTRKELRGAIIGMVLGDGSLYQHRFRDGEYKGNYVLDISHCAKQLPYLEWKKDIVQDLFNYPLPIRQRMISNKRTGKTYKAFRLQTRVSPRFKFITKNIFIDGKKRITEWALENITVEGLAIWWMDDGCLYKAKNGHGGGIMNFGVYGYPKEDVERLQHWLSEKFNINLRISKNSKSGLFLRRGLSEGAKLFDLISPYIAPSMEYKVEYKDAFKNKKNFSLSTSLEVDRDYWYSSRPLLKKEGDEIVRAM